MVLSLLTTLLAPTRGGERTVAFVAWVAGTSLWLGLVFVAAHLLQELLRGPRG